MGISDIIRRDQDKKAMLKRSLESLVELYSDRIHFIYELLQNAEDAKASRISFRQFADRLEVLHDGVPFTESNVKSLCDAALSDKKYEDGMIGKFGLGFKSVFTICNTVMLYSDPKKGIPNNALPRFAIKIENYIDPTDIDAEWNHEDIYTTKFVFPYHVAGKFYKSEDDLKKNLAEKLQKLNANALLFLKNVKEIECIIRGVEKFYDSENISKLKREQIGENIFKVIPINSKNISNNSYYIFSSLVDNTVRSIDIAFSFVEENSVIKFIRSNLSYISVYFPTEIESGLKFIVQAPFDLTPNRSSLINKSETNTKLIKMLAGLLKESILILKEKDMLTLDLINLLPYKPHGNREDWVLYELYSTVLNMLRTETIIPTVDKNYVTMKNAKVVRGAKLLKLFESIRLCELLNQPNAKWLSSDFTENNQSLKELHRFFTKELEVDEIGPNDLPKLINNNPSFLKKCDEDWLVEFYNYLNSDVKNLLGRNGDLSRVPFVKTSDGNFNSPFISKKIGKTTEFVQNIYLNPRNINYLVEGFQFVDDFIERRSPDFVKTAGITSPDTFDYFIQELKASKELKINNEDTILVQIKQAIKYIRLETKGACELFRELLLLKVVDTNNQSKFLTCLNNSIFRETDKYGVSLFNYFIHLKSSVYILDEQFYLQLGLTPDDLDVLVKIGIKNSIYDKLNENSWIDGVANCYNKGDFRKNLTLEYISEVITFIEKNPSDQNSKYKSSCVFSLLKNIEKHLIGQWQYRTTNPEYRKDVSLIVKLLRDKNWLYTKNKEYKKSYSISRYDLNIDVYGKVDERSSIYEILRFGKNEHDKQAEIERDLSRYTKDEVRLYFIKLLKEEKEWIKAIVKNISNEETEFDPLEDGFLSFPEEKIKDIERLKSITRQRYSNALVVQYKAVLEKKRITHSEFQVKEHIRARYNNFCQICLRPNPYWEIAEIFEEPAKELEQMNLSLCPNCASEYRKIRRNDEVMMDEFKEQLLNIDPEKNTEVSFNGKSIKFTNTHLAEIQEILKLQNGVKN